MQPFLQLLSTSLGPFGPFLSGLAGGLLEGLFSGFGSKPDPTVAQDVMVRNWPKQLEADITLMPTYDLRSSMNITVNAGNANARGIARQLAIELGRA